MEEVIQRIVRLGEAHPEGFDIKLLNQSGVPLQALQDALNILLQKRRLVPLQRDGEVVYKLQTEEDTKKFAQLTSADMMVYYAIQESQRNGIWLNHIKSKTGNPQAEKSVTKLVKRGIVKRVPGINRKHYMLAELNPSEELLGNPLHTDVNLREVQELTLRYAVQKGVVTMNDLVKYINDLHLTETQLSSKHFQQVLSALVLDGEMEEVVSTGLGAFSSIPANTKCYRARKGAAQPGSLFAAIPCGVCPVLSQCSPDGIISPSTCVYYQRWLNW